MLMLRMVCVSYLTDKIEGVLRKTKALLFWIERQQDSPAEELSRIETDRQAERQFLLTDLTFLFLSGTETSQPNRIPQHATSYTR